MIAASLLNPMRDALRKISDRTFKDSKRSHDLKVKKLEPMIIILLSPCLTVVRFAAWMGLILHSPRLPRRNDATTEVTGTLIRWQRPT